MKKSASVLLFTILMTLSGLAQSIDFSPAYEFSNEDSTMMKFLRFRCGDKKILLYPTKIWEVRGTSEAVSFTQAGLNYAEAKFENVSGMPANFDEKSLEVYREAAQKLLPKGITEPVIAGENPNAVEINDWKAYEVTFQFKQDTLKFVRSILFIKLDSKREIRISTTARDGDYEKFRAGVAQLLNTWFERKDA